MFFVRVYGESTDGKNRLGPQKKTDRGTRIILYLCCGTEENMLCGEIIMWVILFLEYYNFKYFTCCIFQ